MVDNLILSLRFSFDLPLVARMSTGRGDERARSGKRTACPEVDGEEVVDDRGVNRFCVRKIEPWVEFRRESKRVERREKNSFVVRCCVAILNNNCSKPCLLQEQQ